MKPRAKHDLTIVKKRERLSPVVFVMDKKCFNEWYNF